MKVSERIRTGGFLQSLVDFLTTDDPKLKVPSLLVKTVAPYLLWRRIKQRRQEQRPTPEEAVNQARVLIQSLLVRRKTKFSYDSLSRVFTIPGARIYITATGMARIVRKDGTSYVLTPSELVLQLDDTLGGIV